MMKSSICSLLLGLLLFTTRLSGQSDKYVPNCPVHIIISLDFSASEIDFIGLLQDALLGITGHFKLSPSQMQIGIVTFNRGANLVLPLTGESEKLDEAIHELSLPYIVYGTDIHASFYVAAEEFRQNSHKGVPKFFVLVSDGDPHAHMRGRGFQEDLEVADRLKMGTYSDDLDPINVITIYTGREEAFYDSFDELLRQRSIQHMYNLATDLTMAYRFNELPSVIRLLMDVSTCL